MKLNPYIRFNGNAKEAMEFYKDCFGGELTMMKVGDSPMAKDMPDSADRIMHSTLEKNGTIIVNAADMMRDKLTVGDNVSISIVCDSEEELRNLFAKLSAGGDVFQEIQEPFWGGLFGYVTDKYKIDWMLSSAPMPTK